MSGCRLPAPTCPTPPAPGGASLRNIALDLLAAGGSAEALARAARQYDAADNMTDRLAALATLSLHDGAERDRAFADFYARYATNALVVDKWFSLQATTPQPGTLEKVRGLTEHPAFSAANPNRLRALVGAFAQGNPTQFNRADGAGYAFLADHILKLDPRNRSWRRGSPLPFAAGASWKPAAAPRRRYSLSGSSARRVFPATFPTSSSARSARNKVSDKSLFSASRAVAVGVL